MNRLFTLVVFALVATVVSCGLHYYLWRRLVHDTELRSPWRGLVSALIALLGACIPLTFVLMRTVEPAISRYLAWPAYVWMGLMFLLFMGLLAVDVARLLGWGARRGVAAARGHDEPGLDAERRAFMARVAGGTVVTAATGTLVMGMREALGELEVREVPIALSRWPRGMDGYVIAQLTDIHVGPTIGRAFVEDIVARTNALEPDIIAITGDLVDGQVATLRDAVAPLGDLRARDGVYFVTGNHEYYSGADEWIAELTRLGIRVLRNERVTITRGADSFDLGGIDDYSAGRFGNGHGPDLERVVAGRDPARELVLLAHQPRQMFESARHGVGLQISGHTHGGQIWPWHYLVRAQQGFLEGLERFQDSQIYVSRGTGYWGPPVRVGAPSEISKLVLRSA